MGERRERPTKRLDNGDLMALAKQSLLADETAEVARPQAPMAEEAAAADDDPLADWEDNPQSLPVAAGSQSNALPTTSRTTTVADPLTTQLLAEVARRTSTMEFDPDEIVEAEREGRAGRDTQEIDPAALTAALREAEKTPIPTAANTKRRTK
jgi:hypothetical protein